MKINKLNGHIEILTGLHIGGGDDVMKIGGIDNPIIKDSNTGFPYIPGSSIKGKMRSLLEWHGKLVAPFEGKPFGSVKLDKILDPNDKLNAINLIKLFGDSNAKSAFGKMGDTKGTAVYNADYVTEKPVGFKVAFCSPILVMSWSSILNFGSGRAPAGVTRSPAASAS